jgi:hypothetical protein
MIWYAYLLEFVAGMLITNAIPHWVFGLTGTPFQSPFAKPSGIGESSPLVNVYWGFANLAGGLALLHHYWPIDCLGWLAVGAGSLALGSFCARHFGKVRAALHSRSA